MNWYELQREELGSEFLHEADNFFLALLRNPKTHSYYDKPIRQGKLNRFPYVIVYEVFDTEIVVYSLFMGKQNISFANLNFTMGGANSVLVADNYATSLFEFEHIHN